MRFTSAVWCISGVAEAFERIIKFYKRHFPDTKPLLIDLTAGERKMYDFLDDYDGVDFLFIDIDPSLEVHIHADSTYAPVREGCAHFVIVDLPYPTKPVSWNVLRYKNISMRKYRRISRKILQETKRILRKDGYLIWKCMDFFKKRERRLVLLHALVTKWANEAGFKLWDLIVAVKSPPTTKRISRSSTVHEYFLIFRKFG